MNAPEIMLILLVVRLVIPVGLLLAVGEAARRLQNASWRNA